MTLEIMACARIIRLDGEAFFQGALHTGAQFVFVERLAAAVGLDQTWQYQFGGFEGGETFTAARGQAFAPATYLIALGDQTRVNDLGVVGTAEGKYHGRFHWPTSSNSAPFFTCQACRAV